MLRRLPTAALLAALFAGNAAHADEYAYFHENILGTSMEVRVRADSEADAAAAEGRVLAEIERLAKVFSGYDASSEFRRWMDARAGPVRVSPELFAVLKASDRWREASGGAFDPRVEALTRAWSAAAKQDRTPTEAERSAALAAMARPAWRLDEAEGTAERLGAFPLSLNAIAKGDIVDAACEAALKGHPETRGIMVCIGGDLRVKGNMKRRIGIADPRRDSETSEPLAHIQLTDEALASSGLHQRGVRIAGKWYGHILDPKAGAPTSHVLSAAVIAPNARDADALATTFCVLPVVESLKLADSLPGVSCLLVAADGRVHRGGGWSRHETARPRVLLASYLLRQPAAEAEVDAKPAWGDANEMLVQFEINLPENARGLRRPYVAVWVEDKDGVAVRTLSLWLLKNNPGPRWHADLRRWYRDDQVRKLVDELDLIETVARPTRPPGKYEVVWDGKDDHGKNLDAGVYTISIEAAREHGTYQIIRKQVTIADRPFVEELKGNVEIKSATLNYRRRADAAK